MPTNNINDSPNTIRNYQPADFSKYLGLKTEAENLGPAGRHVSSQVVAEQLGRPNYFPGQDLFVVEIDGNIVGYIDIAPELAIRRVVLDCWVHPEYRQRGLATGLLGCAVQRAQALGTKVAHVNIAPDNEVARTVLARLGFQCVRRFLELRLDMAQVGGQDIDRAALDYRHLKRGEEDKLTRIQNSAFAGTWGYNPNTVEEIVYRINMSDSSPDNVVLICDEGRIAAYCWTEITGGERKGRIYMIGTVPDYRGRGVGKRALLAGLDHLKSKGAAVAELTVDSKNEAACALYWSVGFEVGTSSLWYQKVLD